MRHRVAENPFPWLSIVDLAEISVGVDGKNDPVRKRELYVRRKPVDW